MTEHDHGWSYKADDTTGHPYGCGPRCPAWAEHFDEWHTQVRASHADMERSVMSNSDRTAECGGTAEHGSHEFNGGMYCPGWGAGIELSAFELAYFSSPGVRARKCGHCGAGEDPGNTLRNRMSWQCGDRKACDQRVARAERARHEGGPWGQNIGIPDKCNCGKAGKWGATGIMPEGHLWYWRNQEHTSGYLAHRPQGLGNCGHSLGGCHTDKCFWQAWNDLNQGHGDGVPPTVTELQHEYNAARVKLAEMATAVETTQRAYTEAVALYAEIGRKMEELTGETP